MACRLLTILALLIIAGCEQSSYSSSHRAAEQEGTSAAAEDADKPDDDDKAAVEVPASEPASSGSDEEQAASQSPSEADSRARGALPTKEITFDDIKFDIEKDSKFERSMLTPQIEELFGRTVRIRGYILPTFQQSGIRNFVLVRDNLECCFGPGAAIYDCIVVDMTAGQSVDYTTRPVAVEGVFGIKELLDFDGITRAIYHLDGKAVK